MWQILLGILFFIGGLGNITSSIGAFFTGIILGGLLIFWGLKKKGFISKGTPKLSVPAVTMRSLEIPRPSTVDGKFFRSFCPDDVKFFPPKEIVSTLPKGLFIPGSEIILKREPSNKYDSGAVALYLSGHKIGYLLRGGLQDMVHEWDEKNWPVECTFVSLKKSRGEYQGYVSLAFYRPQEGQRRLGYHDIDVKSIKPTNPDAITNTPLTGKKVVFCGYFDLPLEEMMQQAVDAGAIMRVAVTKTVDYLIVGKTNSAYLDENGMSNKEATATRLNKEGAKIEIITEEIFKYLATHTLEK